MIDLFVLLTPLLLLGVVALLGFAGCSFHAGEAADTYALNINPSSGPLAGNTTVTITAEDTSGTTPVPAQLFGSNVTVAFGSLTAVPASITDETTVTDVTPASPTAGAVDVTVTYDYPGQSTSSSITQSGGFTYNPAPVLTPLQAVVTNQPVGSTTASASLGVFAAPNKLVVVTVQYGGAGDLTLSSSPTVAFTEIESDLLIDAQGQVATYYAFADLSAGLSVMATISTQSTPNELSVLVSAYDNVDAGGPVLPANQQNNFGSAAPALQFATTSLAAGDLIYAVAVERGGAGLSKGTWSPGANFTPFAGQGSFIMLEYDLLQQADITAGQVNVTATDSSAAVGGLWYLFAMALKHV
jgi:hypothetical protein